ncbi:hypothetical protein ACLMJK_002671 [Lecanora helva]
MSPTPKPTIILVHGAWHTPTHYTTFIHTLQRANYSVSCPHLPTCDPTTRLSSSMYTDAQTIRNQILSLLDDAPQNIIMLLHSYGGIVGTEAVKGLSVHERAAQGLPGGVAHLIYMCAFMLQEGESVGGASLPRPEPDPVRFDEGAKTTSICEPATPLFYADVEVEEARRAEALLVPQSGRAMADGLTHEAWRCVPSTYLMTTRDEILFPGWQERQVRAVRDAGVEVTVERFESSHSPFLSRPGEMVDAVVRAVERRS